VDGASDDSGSVVGASVDSGSVAAGCDEDAPVDTVSVDAGSLDVDSSSSSPHAAATRLNAASAATTNFDDLMDAPLDAQLVVIFGQ
jgi:hypothetical protein